MKTIEKRKSNFELLRIIAIIMIIMFHSVLETVTSNNGNYLSTNIEAVGEMRFIMDFFGNGGVTLFSMISGYFLINSKETKQIFKRASESAIKFAGLIIYNGIFVTGLGALILLIISKNNIYHINYVASQNIFTDANVIFGFMGGYWYLVAYFLLLIFIKPLNSFLNNIESQNSFFNLLVVIIFASTIINYVPIFAVRDGVNFPLVFIGYLLGAFERKFNPLKKWSNKLIFILLSIYPIYFVVTFEFLTRILNVPSRTANPAVGYYVGFPIYIFAFLIFTLFMRLDFTSKIVNMIAPATVFTYIFHTASPYGVFYTVAFKLYRDFVKIFGVSNPSLILFLPMIVFMYALIILLISVILFYFYNSFNKYILSINKAEKIKI